MIIFVIFCTPFATTVRYKNKNGTMDTSINTLVKKLLMGTITADEQRQLQQWFDSHPDARSELQALVEDSNLTTRYQQYDDIDMERAWERFTAGGRFSNKKPATRTVALRRWMAAAAAVALLIVGGLYWYWQEARVIPPVISEQVLAAMQQSQQAGRQEATIEKIHPQKTHPRPLPVREGSIYSQGNKSTDSLSTPLPHRKGPGESLLVEKMLAAKRITTRSDKEYWLTLSDGTLVHLNYNTRVIYPEKFVGDTRDVILEGEAYFMVAKDRRHPFIVHTPQGDVKVYGTEFNVSTRTEQTEVVLVEGSVGVTPAGGTELKMHPGQKWSAANGQWSMEDVDVDPYVAWNTGQFAFEHWPLQKIMTVLALWHNCKVEFCALELGAKVLSGNFSRYDGIESTMKALEAATGYQFVLEGHTITISY